MAAREGAIRVVLADRNAIVLSGLERTFSEDERFRVAAVAADGERFLEAVERLSFDVGVIGWTMPYLDGRGVLQAMRDRTAAPRVVVYAEDPNQELPRQVMALGGAGFCPNSAPPQELRDTVAAVASGRMVFPYVDVRMLDTDPFAGLTRRERELLGHLRTGRTTAALAADLGISVNTVKYHLKNLYGKLGVRNRTQAVGAYLTNLAERRQEPELPDSVAAEKPTE
ncbi:MAG: response regulator transcription factor [Proteobacteria bacterium]|nr:response regulator transcription factor [Pseudomonadota bacterium]